MRGSAALWLLCLLAGCGRAPDVTFTLKVQPLASNPAQVEVVATVSDARVWPRGRSKDGNNQFERILSVRTVNAAVNSQPALPLFGTYTVAGVELRFRPAHPLLAGQKYQVRFDPRALASPAARRAVPLTNDYAVPAAAPVAAPKLVALYPTSGELPANHLKFYLLFSEPMRQGEFLKHVKLLDANGREVPEPFRETELWSADGRRLTLWFHPGRQKTGVNLNVEIGPVLEPGQAYRLVVSGAWPSERGVALGSDTVKDFRALVAGRSRVDVNTWQLSGANAGTRSQLTVTFPQPLDWALLNNQLTVETARGQRVNGEFEVTDHETRWRFTPSQPWSGGDYRLAIGTVLEDLAGNSVAKPFEVDMQAAPSAGVGPVDYRRFTVK